MQMQKTAMASIRRFILNHIFSFRITDIGSVELQHFEVANNPRHDSFGIPVGKLPHTQVRRDKSSKRTIIPHINDLK